MWPLAEAVRAYVLPIDRNAGTSVPFDPSDQGEFDLDAAPSPFQDLGWVENFQRTSGTKYETLRTGPQSTLTAQYRAQFDAGVEFDLPNWGKLQMALAGGGQQINVLATPMTSLPRGSGGIATPAVYVQDGATMYELPLAAADLANFQIGDVVAVDADYTGQAGYLGARRSRHLPGDGAGCGITCRPGTTRYFQCCASVEQNTDVADPEPTADWRRADWHGRTESRGADGP